MAKQTDREWWICVLDFVVLCGLVIIVKVWL